MQGTTSASLVGRNAGPVSTWAADVRGALKVWRRTPVLPFVGLVIAAAAFLPYPFLPRPAGCGVGVHPACTSGNQHAFLLLTLLSLPVTLFGIGFLGAERWWYAQVAAGRVPNGAQLWRLSWAYWGRFFRLGLLVAALSAPVVVPLLIGTRHSDIGRALVLGLNGLVLDLALTFVTPALALSTDSAWQAVKHGVALLDRLWPRDVMYVVVPPLALTIVARLAPAAFSSTVIPAAAGVIAQMLTLLFAGATTLLYVREIEPGAPARLAAGTAPRRRPVRSVALEDHPDLREVLQRVEHAYPSQEPPRDTT